MNLRPNLLPALGVFAAAARHQNFAHAAEELHLTASAVSQTQINLTWSDNSWVETSYVVARSTTSGGPSPSSTPGASSATCW